MSYHIAVDIGGTQIRAACFKTDSLTPQNLTRLSTQHPYLSPLERIEEAITSVCPPGETIERIGVAAPGPVDPYQGIIRAAPNIPGWVNMPLKERLEDYFHIPVVLGNDANLAALGEWKYGAGQGHHHLFYMTVSTGIGGGIIIEDRLLLGSSGLAAEIGHITVALDGPVCGCGKKGHLEAVASGTAIARWVEEQLTMGAVSTLPANQPLSAREIAHAAKAGDTLCVTAMERAGRFIGQALADFLHLFNPSIVIIGGGVSKSGPIILDPIQSALKENVLSPHYLDNLTLTTAELGDKAGLVGALALARLPDQ